MKNQSNKNSNFSESLSHAFDGLRTAFADERNIRTHIFVGVIVLAASFILPLTANEWLWILLVIFGVIITELMNTMIENLVYLVTEDYHPLAKKVKDVAAGTVVVTALFSVIVGVVIFLPKIINLFI